MKFNTAVDSGSDAHFLIMTKKKPAELHFHQSVEQSHQELHDQFDRT